MLQIVSRASLMVGFIWACFDSDNLTWHDRISGTVITEFPATADSVLDTETATDVS